jgi:hypothetical protein
MRLSFLFAATCLAAPFALLAGCSQAPANDSEAAETPEALHAAALETNIENPAIIDAETAAELERQVAESYEDWESFDIRQPPFALTPRLDTLMTAERDYVDEHGEPLMLDFDWHIGGQDAEISNVHVRHEAVETGLVIVTASFENFGEPVEVNYIWRQVDGGGWALDDATLEDPDGTMMSLGSILSEGAPY